MDSFAHNFLLPLHRHYSYVNEFYNILGRNAANIPVLDKMSSIVKPLLYFFNCASGGLFQIMGKSVFERVFSTLTKTHTLAVCLQQYFPSLHVHSVLTILLSSDTCMHWFYCTTKYTKNSLHNVHRVMTSFIMINKTRLVRQLLENTHFRFSVYWLLPEFLAKQYHRWKFHFLFSPQLHRLRENFS